MLRATRVVPATAVKPERVADQVSLDADDRHRRRVAMTAQGGLDFLLDLPKATLLRHGDGLVLEDGRIVVVAAQPEALIEISAATPARLARLAWHIGNRHTEVQILEERLRIRRDPVLEGMLRGLGATLVTVEAPFDPEPGAYAHPEPSDHSHHHDHAHGHTHEHDG